MPVNTTIAQDIAKGEEALKYFHNHACRFPQNYKMSFDALKAQIKAKSPAFFEGLGFAIHVAQMSDSKVRAAMERVAEQGQGRIPSPLNGFFNALSNEATKISFVDAIGYTAKESAKDIVKGAAHVGDAVITTGKTLSLIMPLAIVAAVLYIGYGKAKGMAGL